MIDNLKQLKNHKFFGIVECSIRTEKCDPITNFLSQLGTNLKYRKRKSGFYIFKGGLLKPIHLKIMDTHNKLTFKFTKSTLSFIDKLVDIATRGSQKCELTCSTYYKKNSSKIYSNIANYSSVKVITYPQAGLLTIQGSFDRQVNKPSNIMNNLLMK